MQTGGSSSSRNKTVPDYFYMYPGNRIFVVPTPRAKHPIVGELSFDFPEMRRIPKGTPRPPADTGYARVELPVDHPTRYRKTFHARLEALPDVILDRLDSDEEVCCYIVEGLNVYHAKRTNRFDKSAKLEFTTVFVQVKNLDYALYGSFKRYERRDPLLVIKLW
ncbi:uncharacterized protein LOC117172680 isoform X2 [Belonocnema kinseyi]|nr:uncharacterized protein LOC117172680 isoform X2 [Belonocnema kinseyi]